MTSRIVAAIVVLAGASLHCAQILGDDYCKADDADCPTASASIGAGNSAAIGGHGGAGGAQGGGGASAGPGGSSNIPDCSVAPGTIDEMASLQGESAAFQWDPQIEVAAPDDNAIVYMVSREVSGDGEHLELYRHGQIGIQRDVALGGRMLAAAADASQQAAFFLFQDEGAPFVRLVRYQYNGSTAPSVQIVVDPGPFPYPLHAAAILPVSSSTTAFVLSTEVGGPPRAYFLLFSGPFAQPHQFTLPEGNLVAEEMRPMGLVANGSGGFFAFVGGPGPSVTRGTRLYDLTPVPSQQAPATTFPAELHLVHATASGGNRTLAVEDATTAGTFALRSVTLAAAAVAGAMPETFPVTASFPSSLLPSNAWRFRTNGHVVIMGKSAVDPKIGELAVVSYAEGLQGTGTLDFRPTISDHEQIEFFMLRPRDAFPSTPTLDGVVMTEHGGYKKLFTFEVTCAAPR